MVNYQRRGGGKMAEYKYVSYETHGVNATKFYKKFDVTISGVSRATGTHRESVSKIPIDGASKQNTEKIIVYLEEVSVDDYDYAIQQCKREIIEALRGLEEAWQNYQKKEEILKPLFFYSGADEGT